MAFSRLTPKKRKFIDEYIENGGHGPAAARAAYNVSTGNSARVMAHRILHDPAALDYLASEIHEAQLVDQAGNSLKDGLGACKIVNGKLTKAPDYAIRLKAAEFVFKLAMIVEGIDPKSKG